VLSSLDDALQRERDLSAENERYKKEEASVDHAFAALLVNGAVRQTPFVQDQKWLLNDGTVEMVVRVYAGKAKAAVVFQITNQSSDRPWKLKEARLSSVGTWKSRPFALRMNQPEIAPGAVGTLAVVADRSAFALETGRVDLNLELFREDGLRQAFVLLDHRLAHE
jgi:hypothetical protein